MGIKATKDDLAAWAAKGLIPPAPAAVPRPKRLAAPKVATVAGPRWTLTLRLGCRVISEANRRDHWTVKRRRVEIQAHALAAAVRRFGFTPAVPVVVTWVHVGPEMDDDNLRSAFKGLRDELARGYLRVDDADPRVVWAYEQRPGTPGVEVRIEGGGA